MQLVAFLLIAAQADAPPTPATGNPGGGGANLASYFSTDDYPVTSWVNQEEGTVRFRLTINPQGRVAACDVTQSSGFEALDRRTCEILTVRARYSPARDARGDPASGADSGSVTWRLPPDREEPPGLGPTPAKPPRADLRPFFTAPDYPPEALRAREEGVVRFAVLVGVTGRVQACVIAGSSGSAALDAATCAILFTRVRYSPARDGAGRPMAGPDVGQVTWRLPG